LDVGAGAYAEVENEEEEGGAKVENEEEAIEGNATPPNWYWISCIVTVTEKEKRE
jgi:hypothetical protein